MPEELKTDSVGIVSPKCIHFDEDLALRSGKTLSGFDLMIETYGELNQDRSNAILICHALSGDHHAAGFTARAMQNRVGGIIVSVRARPSIRIFFRRRAE